MKGTRSVLVVLMLGALLAEASGYARYQVPVGVASELKASIREWDVPTKGAHPHDAAVGPDGALWFAEQATNKMGRLNPNTGEFKEFPLTDDKNPGPRGLTFDHDGNIWYAANSGGFIGKFNAKSGKVTVFKMPDPKAEDPLSLVFDAKGILWFTVPRANMVGRLDPATGEIILKKVPTENSMPYGIVVLKRGVPIFSELRSNKVGVINPGMSIQEFILPPSVRPRRIAITKDDNTVYFADYRDGNLGKLDLSIGAVVMFATPGGPDASPRGLAITADGMVWYSESGENPNKIIRFDPRTYTFARVSIPSGGGGVDNIATTPEGKLYVACPEVDKVALVDPSK